MAVVVSPLTFLNPLPLFTGRGPAQPGVQVRSHVSFSRVPGQHLQQNGGRRAGIRSCYAEGEGKCSCGGSGSETRGRGENCSNTGSTKSSVAGIGEEFNALVARKTMEEFESQYETGQMKGSITRDVIEDVVGIFPDALVKRTEERFLDINEVLAQARSMSGSEEAFVFDAEFEDMFV